MKSAITITARTKSTRLPLKVMRYIKGKPMIEHMMDRLKTSKLSDDIVMCTSTDPQDDILVDVSEKKGIKYFRGSKDDVLDRLYNASKKFNIDFIVSTTADNPLVDPIYIDKIIKTFKETNADYITCMNLPLGTYSYGIKVKALEKVIELKKENDTEIWGHFFEETKEFKKIDLEIEDDLKHPEIRLTVDEIEDLKLMRIIFSKFYRKDNNFKLKKVVKFLLENPDLMDINKNVFHWTKAEKS